MNKKHIVYIFLITLLVRMPVFFRLSEQPIRFYWNSDSYNYENIALNLLQYEIFSGDIQPPLTHNIYRTPVYPLFIAASYLLTGHSVAATIFLQVLIGSLVPSLMIVLASSLKLPPVVGWISGLMITFDPLIGLFTYQLITEVFFIFFLLLTMIMLALYLSSRHLGWIVGSAVCLALTSLTRPISQYLPFVLLPLFFLGMDRKKWNHVWKGILLFLVINLFITYSWAYRNYSQTGVWTLSAISNQNLFYYRARDVYMEVENVNKPQAVAELKQFLQSKVEENNLTKAEELKLMSKTAFEIFRQHPLITIKVHLKGFLRVMGNPGVSLICTTFDKKEIIFDKEKNILSCEANVNASLLEQARESIGKMNWFEKMILIWEALLLAITGIASILGVWHLLRERQWYVLYFLLIPAIYFAVLSSGAESNARFRIPILPFLDLLAGIGIYSVFLKRNVEGIPNKGL